MLFINLDIFLIDFNLTLGCYLAFVPQFPHLWKMDVKSRWLIWSCFWNSVSFGYSHLLPSLGLLVYFFLRFGLWFVIYMKEDMLRYFVFGTLLAKYIHLFCVKPRCYGIFPMYQPSEAFLPHWKWLCFPELGINNWVYNLAFQVLNFVLFKVLYSTEFIAVISCF